MSEQTGGLEQALQRQAEFIAELRATGLFAGVSDAEVWQAAVRIGERHGAGTAKRDPAAVARELGRRSMMMGCPAKQVWRDLRCWLFTHDKADEPNLLGWHCRRCDRLGFDFSPYAKRPPLRRLGRRTLRERGGQR